MSDFVHLHLHTEFSLLDGMGKVDDYISRASEYGMSHVAVTDHGVMYAAMDFYKAATKAGISPIIGIEAYLADGSMTEKKRKMYHLLLLCENETGYRNLLKLASRASLDGYYYHPRIDLDLLQKHHEGLIATSACLGGPVANNFLMNQPDAARRFAGNLAEIFGPERFFIEVQDHGIPEQISTNRELLPLARSLNLPIVATNDVHYAAEEDAPAQEILVCVQTNTVLSDPKRLKMGSTQLFFKSGQQMASVFADLPEALANTRRIAEMCSVDLTPKGFQLPNFEAPDGLTCEEYLGKLCLEGVINLYGHAGGEVGERLAYELGLIKSMGFTNYFLVVWDFVKFAKDRGILVGPGRGSAAGSIVSYALGITALDPLKHGLIFERFLNPGRLTMPDIDIDFADDRRAEVIDYVVRKYGDDRVAQIVTFGTLAAKASVRDVGRAMGLSTSDTDRVAKLIPGGPGVTIESAMSKVPELRALYDSQPELRELIDTARKVEGVARHSSTHAAGVVISRDPLVDHVPLQRAGGKSEGEITTQYPMGHLEELGLLKMDFLGLKTLTVLGRAVELARHKRPDLTLDNIPMDDEATYALLRRGETVGIFQLEGGMTTRMTVDVAPTAFEDVVALMALIRPGPMEMAPDFISRKHGKTPIEYMHPKMNTILKETYGIALYQEQVLQIANVFAGFSMSEGDALRKAMGKKLPEEMAKHRDRFVQGCVENEIEAKLGGEIFDLIERFAGYGFNKAHSAAYAVIAAQTAFMKANFPVEFMAALLTSEIGNAEKMVSNIVECRRAGIRVLPPDVNSSETEFSVEEQTDGSEAVRFGLNAIRNVGGGAATSLVASRRDAPGGRFFDLEMFCERLDWSACSKRTVECLARSGSLDCFGARSRVMAALDALISAGQQRQRAAARGQIGMFGGEAQSTSIRAVSSLPDVPDLARTQLLGWEKELLGTYLSDHPLTDISLRAQRAGYAQVIELADREAGEQVRLVGLAVSTRRVQTRTNRTMAIVELEDITGNVELVLFPNVFDQFADLLDSGDVLNITARIDRRNDQPQLVCESISTDISAFMEPELVVRRRMILSLEHCANIEDDHRLLQQIDHLLSEFEGDDELMLKLRRDGRRVLLRSRKHRVDASSTLKVALERMLGANRVTIAETSSPVR